ncbi:MAG TPA: AfsR/SARP family transcriptional regulator [Pseudonocardiaceae bacterium]|jgi:DNA-binding SARP family transcriptional activator|nr:AfsR/SARP family transcriptional regulator [Pseudonocardiaceae bacterium]
MRIQVLGQFVMAADGDSGTAVPTARMPKKMLALLAVNAGRMVQSHSLIAELWDDSPPKSATTTLQTYILHVRKRLGESLGMPPGAVADRMLTTRSLGYCLHVPAADLDVHEYHRLDALGLRSLREGDGHAAVARFRQALALWHGTPLMDVDHGRLLTAEVAQLEQSRITTLERCIETQLRLGQHREILGELASLVRSHRFSESLHATYMVALHRSGWRARALEVFRQLRDSMVEELGVEPTPRLHQLQAAILSSAPQLDEMYEPV